MPSITKRLALKAAQMLYRYTFSIDGTGYRRSEGGGTHAGAYVDRNSALTSATFAACLNLIGGTIGALGFEVMREKRSGSREVVSDHPLHEVIKYEPDLHSTGFEYWQRKVWFQELTGNAYSRILRSGERIIGLECLETDRVTLNTDRSEWVYQYQKQVGGPEDIREPNMFHLRNWSLDGKSGISTIEQARQRIGLDLAVEKYGSTFFGKGGRIKDLFKVDGTPNQEQRDKFNALFREHYGNDDSFHEVMLIERGMEYVGKQGATPNEAQFIETQVQNAIVLCRFMGVPPTMVGIYDRMSYNSQEQLALQFLQLCLWPRVERIEQAARRTLLTKDEKRGGYYIHSKVQKVLRGDMRTRSEFYKTLMSLGAMNAEEIRDLEDLPRIGTDEASEYLRAVNIFGQDTPEQAGADAGTTAAQDEIRRETA